MLARLLRRRLVVALGLLATAAGCSAAAEADTDSTADEIKLAELPIMVKQPQAGLFDQEIDHARDGSPSIGTFKQRYWYTTEFATGPESPVLFHFCGESACSAGSLMALGDAAKALHASIVTLEHRYYGESVPFEELTLEKLKYLTIHNALEDTATFQRAVTETLPLKGKWIAVGGSYAGMLAAFYRDKHPELVAGAWASSAPIDVQKTFWGYDALVSRSLGPGCTGLMQQALAKAELVWADPAQRSAMTKAFFKAEWPETQKVYFLRTLSGAAAGAAQYGNTKTICSALQQHADDPLAGLAGYFNPPLAPDDEPVVPPTPPATPGVEMETVGGEVTSFPLGLGPAEPTPADEAVVFPKGNAGLMWQYQTCAEVGFFRVPNPDRTLSVMSALIGESLYDEDCDRRFQRRPEIDKTRAEYYTPLLEGHASHVFFTNGSLDPWSALSFVDPAATHGDNGVFVMQLLSHCEDMTTLQRSSPLPVFESHHQFNILAKTWLAP